MAREAVGVNKWKEVHDVLLEYGESGSADGQPADAMAELQRLLPDRGLSRVFAWLQVMFELITSIPRSIAG